LSVIANVGGLIRQPSIPRPDRRVLDLRDLCLKLAILLGAALVLTATLIYSPLRVAADVLWASTAGRVFITLGGVYGLFATCWTFWRLWLAIRYRSVAEVATDLLPRVTVVVPAYNEGALVGQTIRHLAAADFPRDRFEIIVVDDGSDDDTWSHIAAAVAAVGPVAKAIQCPRNRGKRWALWEGFRRATGDVLVTVDSDSLIQPDALRKIISPMVRDPRVGAVAGNVRVLNREGGLIPRMLGVRYVMTFDYKRAAQSMMGGGAVLCCAGALAAYRRSSVMPILPEWLHQTFRGGPARAGEDHAMTNFILRQGYKVVYQRTARVVTKCPTTYTGLCKMFLRWARSNIRETLHTGAYVFGAFRPESRAGIRFNFIMGAVGQALPVPIMCASLLLALALPLIFGLKLLASCVTAGLFSVAFFAWRERTTDAVLAIPYSLYATLLLCWIQPYALLTCRRSVWLTRVPKAPPSPDVAPRRRRAA